MAKENLSEIIVRNSTYDLISNFIAKFGGMVFTIFILARLLGPELFGVYNLAFSIIAIILTFTDLGISSASIRYLSEAFGKKDKPKARTYFSYFLKIKFFIVAFAVILLLLISKYLAFSFYEKPLLFYPLVFACIYLFISSFSTITQTILYALKDFRKFPKIQLLEQTSKIVLAIAAIFIFTYNFEVPGIFLALGISSFFVFIYSLFIVLKKDKKLVFGKKIKIEKPRILKYTGYMAIASVSLVFFASIDTLMLGKFVDSAHIGYYRAALGLVLSLGAIIAFRAILIPVFTQISRQRLKRGFEKISKYNLMLSIPVSIGTFFIARNIIRFLYGEDFILAAVPLYVLSFLIITASLLSIYRPLFQAKEKTKALSKIAYSCPNSSSDLIKT
jgi:O-antigen/teichoic acid export membrane protein